MGGSHSTEERDFFLGIDINKGKETANFITLKLGVGINYGPNAEMFRRMIQLADDLRNRIWDLDTVEIYSCDSNRNKTSYPYTKNIDLNIIKSLLEKVEPLAPAWIRKYSMLRIETHFLPVDQEEFCTCVLILLESCGYFTTNLVGVRIRSYFEHVAIGILGRETTMRKIELGIGSNVLITGGITRAGQYVDKSLIYNVITDKITEIEGFVPRVRHASVNLLCNKVLICGGQFSEIDVRSISNRTELYDPITQEFEIRAPMKIPRCFHTLVRLVDGRVLAIGGLSIEPGRPRAYAIFSAEIYDPKRNTWTLCVGELKYPRVRAGAALMNNGNVIIAGGSESFTQERRITQMEIYNVAEDKFTYYESFEKTDGASAVRLSDGKIAFFIVSGDM